MLVLHTRKSYFKERKDQRDGSRKKLLLRLEPTLVQEENKLQTVVAKPDYFLGVVFYFESYHLWREIKKIKIVVRLYDQGLNFYMCT